MIFHRHLRKNAEIIRNFIAKILKICPKKVYSLIHYMVNHGNRQEQQARWTQELQELSDELARLQAQSDQLAAIRADSIPHGLRSMEIEKRVFLPVSRGLGRLFFF